MRLFLLFSLLVNLFLLSSCKKYQPADAAFFIQSDAVSVSTTPSQGTGSHKITDLWLYVNGKYQGTYPVGSLLPVISNDKGVGINVFAGIKNNGIADTRIFYPFFDFLKIDTLVGTGKTIPRNFTFKYKSATVFAWMENFESPSGYSLKSTGDKNFELASAEDSFEGKSIKVSLPGASYVSARVESSSDGFTLPTASSNVFLELNYKCNTPFTIGLTDKDGGQESAAIVVNPQENWNKIYVQLSTALNAIVTTKYKVFIKFTKSPTDTDTKEVFLDNIKLLYF